MSLLCYLGLHKWAFLSWTYASFGSYRCSRCGRVRYG